MSYKIEVRPSHPPIYDIQSTAFQPPASPLLTHPPTHPPTHSIQNHDYGVRMKQMTRFLEEGDKVKVRPTHPPTHPPTHLFNHPPTHPPSHTGHDSIPRERAATHRPRYVPTHPPTHPPTHGAHSNRLLLLHPPTHLYTRVAHSNRLLLLHLPTHPPLHTGHELLGKVAEDLKELATKEGDIRREGGRLITMFKVTTHPPTHPPTH